MMKWLLVMLVSGSPVKTDLYFPTLRECLLAEDRIAKEYVAAYNELVSWAKQNASTNLRASKNWRAIDCIEGRAFQLPPLGEDDPMGRHAH